MAQRPQREKSPFIYGFLCVLCGLSEEIIYPLFVNKNFCNLKNAKKSDGNKKSQPYMLRFIFFFAAISIFIFRRASQGIDSSRHFLSVQDRQKLRIFKVCNIFKDRNCLLQLIHAYSRFAMFSETEIVCNN